MEQIKLYKAGGGGWCGEWITDKFRTRTNPLSLISRSVFFFRGYNLSLELSRKRSKGIKNSKRKKNRPTISRSPRWVISHRYRSVGVILQSMTRWNNTPDDGLGQTRLFWEEKSCRVERACLWCRISTLIFTYTIICGVIVHSHFSKIYPTLSPVLHALNSEIMAKRKNTLFLNRS